jgi:micrococcal nuclease
MAAAGFAMRDPRIRRSRAALVAAAIAVGAAGCQPLPGPAPDSNAGRAPTAPTAAGAPSSRRHGPYPVIRVVDGDTLHAAIGKADITVRVKGIDTPETVDPREPVQCFGPQASARAHQLLDGQQVYLSYDPSQSRVDAYGRRLAYVRLPDGTDFGLLMIREGYAREYTFAAPYARQTAYRAAQADARAHHRGLWGACPATARP